MSRRCEDVMIILIVFDFHLVGFSLISIWSMEMMIGLTALDSGCWILIRF